MSALDKPLSPLTANVFYGQPLIIIIFVWEGAEENFVVEFCPSSP